MSATDEELWEFVQARELPLVLTRLSDFTIQAATEAALVEVDMSADEVLGCSVFDFLDANERPRARAALQAIADGVIDFFRTYQPLSRAHTREPGVYLWSHAIAFGPRRYALTEIRAAEAPTASPLTESLGYEPSRFAIGVVNTFGIVTSVSNDVSDVIGVAADRLLGRSLLTRDGKEIWTRLHSSPEAFDGISVSLPYRASASSSSSVEIRCLLTSMAGSDTSCFLLIEESKSKTPASSTRTAELEHHLLRIAREVQASGVIGGMGRIPDLARFPQLNSLNSRQWDVLNHLLRGDRVPAIADEMFLTQSAVRNHLSALYRKFGVHSQSDLLALLRSYDEIVRQTGRDAGHVGEGLVAGCTGEETAPGRRGEF